MKVAIVSRNRATETTPATQPPTPGMLDSFVDSVQGGLEACGVLEKGGESASSQMHKWQSGQRVGGEKFAQAPVWGIAPVLSDDEEDASDGAPGGEGEYDDVELVLQQTPDRTGGARTTTAARRRRRTTGTTSGRRTDARRWTRRTAPRSTGPWCAR